MSITIRPQEKTAEQATLDEIERSLMAGYLSLRGTVTRVQQLVYQNPHGLTPHQVVALLGTKAVQIFAVATLAKEALNVAGEGIESIMPEGWSYTANPDGTVTLTEPAPGE